MLGIKILCWAYVIFTVMGSVANYSNTEENAIKLRIVDNVTICVMVLLLAMLYS